MKRISALIVCLCLVLCSCAEKSRSKDSDRPVLINFYDNIYDFGEFYMDFQDRICFGDLNSLVSLPICSKPNCLHNTQDCGSCGLPANTLMMYYDGNLYYFIDSIVRHDDEFEYNCEVYRCRLNGEDRKKIGSLPAEFSSSYAGSSRILDGSTVYFTASKPILENGTVSKNNSYYICKYDLISNEFGEIARLCEGYYGYAGLMGIFDGRIYIKHCSYPEIVENADRDFYESIYSYSFFDMKAGEISDADCVPLCIAEGFIAAKDEEGKLNVTDEDGEIYLPERFNVSDDDWYEIHNGMLFSMEDNTAFEIKSGEYYKVNLWLSNEDGEVALIGE